MKRLESGDTSRLRGGRFAPRDKDNPDSFKVRRGKVGGYRDYFSEAQAAEIEALIDADLSPVFGYRAQAAAKPAESA
jgi:alcohol sulfotransferase